jgi:2-isopropylmalate synthase
MTDQQYFKVCGYKVVSQRSTREGERVQAIVEVEVAKAFVRRAAAGVGPVHALDNALRLCLEERFPEIEGVRLSDYRVSVVDATGGTGAQVRVLVEAADGHGRWAAERTSSNILEASFEALCETAATGIERGRSILGGSNGYVEQVAL